jgi:ribonuclease-3
MHRCTDERFFLATVFLSYIHPFRNRRIQTESSFGRANTVTAKKHMRRKDGNESTMDEFEKIIEYEFKNKNLMKTALVHSSYSNESENKPQSYERLEFLGDSILGMITSEYIFKNSPRLSEGDLTKLRASLVCEKALYKFSKSIDAGKFVKLSRGEKRSGGNERMSILADVFESIVAAIYLDGGFEEAKKFVHRFIVPEYETHDKNSIRDYKTDLQEVCQKNPDEIVEYILVNESGPDHDKIFSVEVRINNNPIGKGSGRSKKNAEQIAAKEALKMMGY